MLPLVVYLLMDIGQLLVNGIVVCGFHDFIYGGFLHALVSIWVSKCSRKRILAVAKNLTSGEYIRIWGTGTLRLGDVIDLETLIFNDHRTAAEIDELAKGYQEFCLAIPRADGNEQNSYSTITAKSQVMVSK